MTFQPMAVPLLNAQQSSPYAGLIQNMLSNYQNAVQARYAPQQQQADIFSKQFAPLAQIASSPLAQAMLPDQKNQMAALISQLLQQSGAGMTGGAGGVTGGTNIGAGSLGGNVSAGTPNVGNVGVNQGATSPGTGSSSVGGGTQSGYNPNLPSAGNLGGNVGQKVTSQYNEQLHEPGKSYTDQYGHQYVASSSDVVSAGQRKDSALDALKEMLPNLVQDSQEFSVPGSFVRTSRSAAGNTATQLGFPKLGNFIGPDQAAVGHYNHFTGDQLQAIDYLNSIMPHSQSEGTFQQFVDAFKFHPLTDVGNSYADRITKTFADLEKQQRPIARKMMGGEGGYSLDNTPSNAPSNAPSNVQNTPSTLQNESIAPAEKTVMLNGKLHKKINGKWYSE